MPETTRAVELVDDGLSATGPLAVEKSDDFPTARPFAHKLHSAPIVFIKIILEDTRRIPERPFFLFATLALGLSGVKLLWDGLVG